jgi:adenine-specific DNA-methyltransferase
MASLLEQLPKIVADGKREAERIMERLESSYRIGLQTRELVIPSRDSNWQDMFAKSQKASHDLNPANMNRLIYGDNLLAMAALLAGNEQIPSLRGKIDLIYIDPPFDSKADYRSKINLPGGEIEQLPTAIEQFAYSDTWHDGTASYLSMLSPRLYLMNEILQKDGVIAIHIGPSVSHYVKIVLDEIFGKDRYLNEIVWQRRLGQSNADRKKMGIVTDSIFIYTKSEDFIFNPQFTMEGADEYIKERYTKVDENGRKYKTGDLGNPAPRPTLRYEYKGHKPPPNGWAVSLETMKKMDKEGRLEFPSKPGGRLMRRQFLDEWKGKPIQSLWADIPPINSQAKERIGYDTQKPERLIGRIMEFFTNEGSTVADFFVGSGTTAAIAEKMGRIWLATDFGKPSCMIARKRLIDQDAKPFLYQHVGDYQVEMARSTMGRKFRIGDLAEIVLGLYGALPLPAEENPNRNMGRVSHTKTLVLADSPNKLTGLTTLKRAIEIRDNLMGGWDKVVVLGWNFDSNIGHDIQALNQGDRLEVLVIPPDLLDRLKKKGDKLKAEEVRFSSLQYVKLKPVIRQKENGKEGLTVEIDNYVLLSPDALNLDEANRQKLQKVINKDPMALIEYWSVDPDYDGQLFRSIWQDYRGNTENDDDRYRVVTVARLTDLPPKSGPRRVCVRVVDVFGFEAEAIVEVA